MAGSSYGIEKMRLDQVLPMKTGPGTATFLASKQTLWPIDLAICNTAQSDGYIKQWLAGLARTVKFWTDKNCTEYGFNFTQVNWTWRIKPDRDLALFEGPDDTWGIPDSEEMFAKWIKMNRFVDTNLEDIEVKITETATVKSYAYKIKDVDQALVESNIIKYFCGIKKKLVMDKHGQVKHIININKIVMPQTTN